MITATIASRSRGLPLLVPGAFGAVDGGVVEASLLAKTPVVGGLTGARMQLRTQHASLTTWEVDGGRWTLIGYNDGAHHLGSEGVGATTEGVTPSGRSWMSVGTGERID